ncbi:flagellar motor protein MotB [Planococcus sp. PAMC 21323]|nr:flagellar motor protein MotB [Planococcus sp. PAMC 21323]
MKRKKKHEEHVDEAWLLPYADILTLLLALFIVLFAASEVDSRKFLAISSSFNSELQGGTGVLENEAPVESIEPTKPLQDLKTEDPIEKDEIEILEKEDQEELEEFKKRIDRYIDEKGLSPKLKTELTSKGLMLTITEGVLFQSGKSDIVEQSRTIAKEISELLTTDTPRMIYIEGHTDNVPTGTMEFPSNWELSSARAITFMKILLENKELDPRKFSATGYSEYHPIASNDTKAGRAKNRRVEVLISPYQEETKD